MTALVAALLVAQTHALVLMLEIPGRVDVAGMSLRTSTTATYFIEGDVDRGQVHRCGVRVSSAAGSGATLDHDAPTRAFTGRSFPIDDDVDVTLAVAGVPVRVVTHVRGTVRLGDRGRALVAIDEQRIVTSTIPMHVDARSRIDARYTLKNAVQCPGGAP